MVRISKVKGQFEKGYLPNWSEEDFRIRQVREADPRGEGFRPRVIYELEDRGGEPIKGSWYREELQPISRNRYLIERIIRKRKHPRSEILVKWQGWPTKFNTWIPSDDVEHIGLEGSRPG